MELINNTKFNVQALPFNGPEDKPVLTVIVKATFDFNSSDPALEQIPIAFGDEFFDPENGGSVKFETDVVPFKPKADIVLIGKAYAPDGKPAQSCDACLRVGKLKKSIRVIGDRKWHYEKKSFGAKHKLTDPKPFSTIDIIYENAYGGVDLQNGGFCAQNLIGKGFVVKKLPKENIFLPNLEDPEKLIKSFTDKPKPAGFGFYGKTWEPRVSYIGTYDEKWREERSPDLPEDFKFEYYNSAHPDLQVKEYLQGDEEVELTNLSSDGFCKFHLPGIKLSCFVNKSFETIDESLQPVRENVKLNLDTLCIIPDEKRFYQVWRGLCPIHDIGSSEVKKVTIKAA